MRVSAKSRLGEKLAYIHNHWDGLQTFLIDGRVEIDSNNVENLVRPIALNRKNALFAGHDEGGKAWGRTANKLAIPVKHTGQKIFLIIATLAPKGSCKSISTCYKEVVHCSLNLTE